MYHPTTRVLTVLELLQAHPRMSGPELATRLEVDVRTVRRYIAMLQDLGIPIEASIGRVGGYALRPGFKLPPLMFSEDEALALTLGLLAARQVGLLAAAPAVAGAAAKIDRVLPLALRERVRAFHETLVLDLTPADGTVVGATLSLLATAAQQEQQVWLSYQSSSSGGSERLLDPYGVVSHAGRWYTVGYCHLRNEVRIFRLDRILTIEPRTTHFRRPEGFDVLEHVVHSFAAIPDAWDVEVWIDATLAQVQSLVPRTFGTLETQDNGVVLRTSISDLDHMARFLMSLGHPLRVNQPAELREAFARLAEHAARIARGVL